MTKSYPQCAVLVLTLGAGACATKEPTHRDWSAYTGPGAAEFQREQVTFPALDDPGEPFNRRLDDVKHFAVEYVVAPLADAWTFVVPKPAREALTRFGTNLLYPVRLVSNSVQGEWGTAWLETERFGTNTTIGVLGFFEAAECRGMPAPRAQDTGRALKSMGWEKSSYTELPGATTRDSVGFVGDLLLNPLTYFPPSGLVTSFNDISDDADKYVRFGNTNYDPYRLEKVGRMLHRQLDPTDEAFAAGTGGGVETLQHVFLGVRDPGFPRRAETHAVRIAATSRDMKYDAWIQDHAAPVVFIVPGTGGHRESGGTAALAEMAFRAGYHAVAVSSALSFDFIETAGTSDFPGFAPSDAHDVHVALTAVDADLRERFGALVDSRRAVVGISLGGLHVLYMAAKENAARDEGLVRFDGYVALNPPVSLVRAVRGMDRCFNLPLELMPEKERREARIRALFRHVIDVAGGRDLQPGKPLPLSDDEAKFLIGIAFRMKLLDILDQARALGRTGDFFLTPRSGTDRSASYRELAQYSYLEYLYAFVLPQESRRRPDVTNDEAGAKRLEELCDLRSLQAPLSENERAFVFTNANDLVIDASDVEFLKDTFGVRLELNADGGHLGNLWRPDVQDRVMSRLRATVPVE
jgi:ABC-type transporter lipoprotein component MlaA/pimeloyl-ACP methyl ester carboxylesterase